VDEKFKVEDEKKFKVNVEPEATEGQNCGQRRKEKVRTGIPPRPGYDPSVRLSREPLIYNPQGLTKSERKRYRESEKETWRQQDLRQCVITDGPVFTNYDNSAFINDANLRICKFPGATVGINRDECDIGLIYNPSGWSPPQDTHCNPYDDHDDDNPRKVQKQK